MNDGDLIRNAGQFLQHMPDPIYILDLDRRIVWVNDAFQRLFGYTADELNQEPTRFTLPGGEDAAVRLYRKDGTPVYARCCLVPIPNEDKETAAYSVVLKQCEEPHPAGPLVSKSEERYKIAAENTSDTIVLVDNEAIVRYVSPSIKTISGYDVEDYEGMDAFDVIHPDDADRVRFLHAEAIRSKLPVDLEYRIVHARGDTVHIEARVMPVPDGSGAVQYVVAVARDVTERKKTEKLLQNILDNVNAAVWSSDKDFARLTLCSESIEKMFGVPKPAVEANPYRLLDRVHPDDRAALAEEIEHKLRRGLPAVKSFRLIDDREESRWVRLIAQPIMDNKGAIERIDGIFLDITEKKRSELALEESEQRYKSLFENNLDGVFSIDLNLYFVNANRAFETITGIELSKLTDRCFMGLVFDEDHAPVYEVLFQVVQHQEPRDIECRIQKGKLGEKIVNITFVPILLSGTLIGVHGIVKDITDRKREERELIQREERYKFLQQSLNRFSNDLTNVMKVSDLEQRLIREVKEVLQVTNASIEEVPRGQEPAVTSPQVTRVKIGEKQHPVYLRINMDRAMLKIEEEWLETAVHYVTILYDNLQLIEDLMKRLEDMVNQNETPKWMLRLLFQLSEKERFSLSSDLHDSVLQDLIIWYRKLESLRSSKPFSEEIRTELIRIEEGLLDAIHQIRITCNELRPPFLLNMGLVESLKSLFTYTRMFANYEIEFAAEPFDCLLNEEEILGVYRIVQELLNNASKHSAAAKVRMALTSDNRGVYFSYSDDGVGIDLASFESSFQHMGITGIEKRVLSLGGEVRFNSSPGQGFHVNLSIPKNMERKGD